MAETRNDIVKCRNCGAVIGFDQRLCGYCRTQRYFVIGHPLQFITRSRIIRQAAIYPMLMLVGISSFLTIYLGYFRSLSETKLITLSPFWIFTFLFGYFGYTAERFLTDYHHRQAESVRGAFFAWHWRVFPFSILYLPVPIFPFKNPLSFAIWGGLVWVIVMRFFFVVAWHSL